jgi:hypothetical protein
MKLLGSKADTFSGLSRSTQQHHAALQNDDPSKKKTPQNDIPVPLAGVQNKGTQQKPLHNATAGTKSRAHTTWKIE